MGSTTRTVHATRSTRTSRSAHRSTASGRGRSSRQQEPRLVRREAQPKPTSPTRPIGALHLTRRGRLVVLVALVALLFAAFSIGRAGTQAATLQAPSASQPPAVVPNVVETTVQPGETLWQLARRTSPRSDPRDVVRQIRTLNHLAESGLQAGQQLLLPN